MAQMLGHPGGTRDSANVTTKLSISQPISAELRELPDSARFVRYTIEDGKAVPVVTVAFHKAFLAEIQARWLRDIHRLNAIKESLEA
jgi:DNA-binding transcriptional regulator GbsR (MarR family)